MVIDTSAILAILLNEPPAERLWRAIRAAPRRALSAATFVEASMVVLARLGPAGTAELDALLRELGMEVLVVTEQQAFLARDAARDFGRGRHDARLNYGDCFSYAAAADLGEPLLFVGDDFTRTDIVAVSY